MTCSVTLLHGHCMNKVAPSKISNIFAIWVTKVNLHNVYLPKEFIADTGGVTCWGGINPGLIKRTVIDM